MNKSATYLLAFLWATILLSSCNTGGKVASRGGYLLVKNNIKCNNPYLPADELEGFIEQPAMSGLVTPYFRPGVLFYEYSVKGKQSGFKNFVRKAFGKKTIILDTNNTNSTVNKLDIYLKNRGFYNAEIQKNIRYRKRTAQVTYNISTGLPRIVKQFEYFIPDTTMKRIILSESGEGKLRNGMIYDTYVLDDERERIANLLRNNSYFNFSLSDIYYQADTSGRGKDAEVQLHIKKLKINPTLGNDSILEISHPRFCINKVFFIPNSQPGQVSARYDTTIYEYAASSSDTATRRIYILHNNDNTIKARFLASCLTLRPGDYYSQQSANQTYKKIISQPLFAAANISMTYADPHYTHPNADQPLDCHIRLIRNKLNAFNIGTEGTNSGGRFGLGINSTIQNRNIFKGAEVLSLKIHTSAEMQSSLNNKDLNTGTTFLFFNTIEGGLEASLDIPRLLIPARKQYVSHTFGQTSLSAGAAFEFRPEYQRMISTAAWSYRWNSSQISRIIFTPLEFNYINIQPSDSFAKYMESLTDPQYKSQYTNHLLTAIRYSYIFSNMGMIKDNSQIFLRFDAETSGNIPFLLDKTTDIPATDEGYYEHFGIRYSQYARLNIDFRKYIKLHRQNSIAFRVSGGMVVPYGNSDVVPFEKNFWLGGANDMRGWRLRSLGPGGYQGNNTRFDKTGEIMLQASIEHRFPIYSFMQGGFFIDAGNVWLRSPNQDFPEGEFKMNQFLNQIAMDLGFGLRFDLSFFIFRLDAAVPFHNPATSLWFSKDDFRIRGSILNFGIGLPF